MHKFRWDDLLFILSVSESGSLSAAARRMGVNHATVFRRISRFEETYSVRLFDRGSKGYTLRPQFRPILERIRSARHSVGSVERMIAGQHDAFGGTVRITSTDSLCQVILAPNIGQFCNRYPEVTVDLASTNLHLDLSRLDADVTVRPTKSLPAELEGEKAGVMVFRVYGSVGYLSKNTSPEIADHLWLGVSEMLARSPVLVWQRSAISEERIAFRTDSFNTIAEVAASGLGLAMLPCFLADRIPGLVQVEKIKETIDNDIWVAAHRDLSSSSRIRACMEFLVSLLKENARSLSGAGI